MSTLDNDTVVPFLDHASIEVRWVLLMRRFRAVNLWRDYRVGDVSVIVAQELINFNRVLGKAFIAIAGEFFGSGVHFPSVTLPGATMSPRILQGSPRGGSPRGGHHAGTEVQTTWGWTHDREVHDEQDHVAHRDNWKLGGEAMHEQLPGALREHFGKTYREKVGWFHAYAN